MRSGWYRESHRHGLAAKGIKTNRFYSQKRYFAPVQLDLKGFSKPQTEVDLDKERAKKLLEEKERTQKALSGKKGSELIVGWDRMLSRFRAEEAVRKGVREKVLDEREVIKAIDQVKKGNTKRAIELLSDPELDMRYPLRRAALERAFTELAARQSEIGQPVSPEVMTVARFGRLDIDPGAITPEQAEMMRAKGFTFGKEQLQALKEGRNVRLSGAQTAQLETAGFASLKQAMEAMKIKEDFETVSGSESPLRQVTRQASRDLAKTITGLPGQSVELVGKSLQNLYESQQGMSRKDFVGLEGQIDGDQKGGMETPFLKGNPFITDNASIQGFSLDPFKTPIPKTSNAFSFVDDFQRQQQQGGLNTVFGTGRKTNSEMVQAQVDSLFDARKDLAKVDLSPFKKGNAAFDKGDREKLIDAITMLQGEESKLKTRWDLVENTDGAIRNFQMNAEVFGNDGVTNVAMARSAGADFIVQNTKKIEDVKNEIKRANNKVFTRRVALQRRLQRLDKNILPEEGAPEFDKIIRFSGDDARRSDGFEVFEVENPFLDMQGDFLK